MVPGVLPACPVRAPRRFPVRVLPVGPGLGQLPRLCDQAIGRQMRPDWDEYFLGIATAAAARSDCERSKVGAVVVKDRRVRATGYNGAPVGKPGCATCPRRTAVAVDPGVTGYDSGPGRCVAVHAEANALLYCDREDLIGATIYITREPCGGCSKLIEAAGISRVVWEEPVDTSVIRIDDPTATAEAIHASMVQQTRRLREWYSRVR